MTHEENIERRLNEAENRRLYGEKAQLLLVHDIYSVMFQIHTYLENTMKNGRTKEEFYLAKILLALYYNSDLSQTDIANNYGMPLSTVATIVKKHTTIPEQTEQKNIKADRFIIVKKADTGKHRTKLALTDYGKQKAEQKWAALMRGVLDNMKEFDKKSTDIKYGFFDDMKFWFRRLYNYTTGQRKYTEQWRLIV